MTRPTSRFTLGGLLAAGAVLLSAAPLQAQTATSGSSSALSGVTVWSARPRNPERLLRLDRESASSCFFSPGSITDHIEGYLASVTGVVYVGRGPNAGLGYHYSALEELPPGYESSYFRAGSLFGPDASQEVGPVVPRFFARFDGVSEGISLSNDWCKRFVAGRAEIARRDTTLPQGFALFEARNYPGALDMFHKAYRKLPDRDGGVEAALMIGKIHLNGLVGSQDMAQAVAWLDKAGGAPFRPLHRISYDPKNPERGYTPIGEACVLLGHIYLTGRGGVPRDLKAARKWFDRAYDSGYVPAGKTLGDIHYYGFGTARDRQKAVAYYSEAAELGFGPAQYAMAELYSTGADGVAQDRGKALAWYNEAARREHAGALYALAQAHDRGQGVPADPQKALIFYKAAALKGHPDAQAALGSHFYEGTVVPKDHVVARKWFEAAAVSAQPDAMFNLGAMMARGEGGTVDRTKAWVWMRIAQEGGVERAPVALSALERRMSPEERRAAAELYTPRRS